MPAAGNFRFPPLHARATLHSAIFRSILFIVSHQPRQPTQECFFHSIALMPTLRFIPLPLAVPTHNPNSTAKTRSFVSPNPFRYISFSLHTCFPNPISSMPNRIVCSRKQESKKFHVLPNGIDEIKECGRA
jgi:hypothetical protein